MQGREFHREDHELYPVQFSGFTLTGLGLVPDTVPKVPYRYNPPFFQYTKVRVRQDFVTTPTAIGGSSGEKKNRRNDPLGSEGLELQRFGHGRDETSVNEVKSNVLPARPWCRVLGRRRNTVLFWGRTKIPCHKFSEFALGKPRVQLFLDRIEL